MAVDLYIDRNLNINLQINYGVLEYVAGLKAEEGWKIRGVAGHNSKAYNQYQNQRKELVKQRLKDNRIKERLNDFMQESLELFYPLVNQEWAKVKEYIGGLDFYFITGFARTGGTYVYKEVSQAVDWPWNDLLPTMTHDNIPDGYFIRGKKNEIGGIGWRRGQNYYNLLFQLAQFLVYVSREVPDAKGVVLKHLSLLHCLSILDEIFGEQAYYLITVRHPAAAIASRAEKWGRKNNKNFKLESFKLWETLYREVVRDAPIIGNLIPLLFGAKMDEFLAKLYKKEGHDAKPEGIKITDRDYDNNFWGQDKIKKRIEKIKLLWELNGYQFPVPKLIK